MLCVASSMPISRKKAKTKFLLRCHFNLGRDQYSKANLQPNFAVASAEGHRPGVASH